VALAWVSPENALCVSGPSPAKQITERQKPAQGLQGPELPQVYLSAPEFLPGCFDNYKRGKRNLRKGGKFTPFPTHARK
jgi:hypothetical protein